MRKYSHTMEISTADIQVIYDLEAMTDADRFFCDPIDEFCDPDDITTRVDDARTREMPETELAQLRSSVARACVCSSGLRLVWRGLLGRCHRLLPTGALVDWDNGTVGVVPWSAFQSGEVAGL